MLNNIINKVNDITEELANDAIDLLRNMIKIPTENPPGLNYERFVEYIGSFLKDLGYRIEIIEPSKEELPKLAPLGEGPRPNLIASLGYGNVKLLFNGHYDVVPAGSGWSVDPYSAEVIDGKVYGRGAADMKSGIAMQIYAVEVVRRLYPDIERKISIVHWIVNDEETVGNVNAGTGYLVDRGLLKGVNYVVFTEPSGYDTLYYGHRGALWGFIKLRGKKAHGGFPQLGIDATHACAQLINKLYGLKAKFNSMISNYEIIPEAGKRPSIMVGTVRCGTWMNTVADECDLSFVRRLIPEEDLDNARKEIMDAVIEISRSTGVNYEYNEYYAIDTIIANKESEIANAFAWAIRQVLHREPRFALSAGTFDMRFIVKAGLRDTVNYGPGRIEQAHATDEYVIIDEFKTSIKIAALAILRLLNII
ncbi:MAG: M20 family metallopeptidase [Vulcanisaeta sp.]